MIDQQLHELLLQSLEHERGGVKLYKTALKCAHRPDLKKEWTKYLSQTENHVVVLSDVCKELGIDPGTHTPGCKVVRDLGTALVTAMETALGQGSPAAAQIVACMCDVGGNQGSRRLGANRRAVVPGIVARIVGP